MIRLTKADSTVIFINPMQIESISANPDTVLTMTNSKKYLIKESAIDISETINKFWIGVYGSKSSEF